MKIILNLLILVQFYACDVNSSSYDWNVETIEPGSDFANNLRVQTLINDELQKNLLKMPHKTNNEDNYDNLFYKKIDNNEYSGFDGDKIHFTDKLFTKNENMQRNSNKNFIFIEKNTPDSNQNIENNNQFNGLSNYGDNEDKNDNHLKLHTKYQNYYKEQITNKHNSPHNNIENNDRQNMFDKDNVEIDRDDDNNNHHVLPYIDYKYTDFKSDRDQAKYKYDYQQNNLNFNKGHGKEHGHGKYENFENFVGTNLIDNTIKRCFSTEEIALLATRRDFENLIPKDLPKCLFNDRMVAVLLNYFYICYKIIIGMTSYGLMHLTQKAFYDTLGGYLNFYMVPVAKYSYYAGHISLNTTQQVLTLHQQCKIFLNTNGNGWKDPIQNVFIEIKSIQIEPLHFSSSSEIYDEPSLCLHLDMDMEKKHEYERNDNKMIVQMPQLEANNANGFLGNVWLPFKRKTIFDLKAESSAYVLVKFYETVTKCYRFENTDQSYYNSRFKSWLLEKIHVHLSDEQFYPGLGAVLRIYEYLKRTKKDTNGNKEGKKMNKIKLTKYRNNKIDNLQKLHNNAKFVNDYDVLNSNGTNQISKNMKYFDKIQQNSTDKTHLKVIEYIKPTTIIEDAKLEPANNFETINSKIKLFILDLTLPQIAVIAIPIIIIILIIIICCYKSFCRKKKLDVPTKKNSSSSSSNLFHSPVRFFNAKPKSLSDYSSYEAGSKKNKKSVKIKSSLNSDTSVSSSPLRNIKSKGKIKDSNKSNSKSSWETTYSSK